MNEDLAAPLGDFCHRLRQLHAEAGGPPIAVLGADADVPLRRTQIHDVLAGRIASPPSWEFVKQFVARCKTHASRSGRTLSVNTDLEWWRQEHTFLANLATRSRRARRTALAPPARPRRARRDGAHELSQQQLMIYRLNRTPDGTRRQLAVITGDIRQVRCADVWVNSENTDMVMARIQESSISAIIRYEGSRRDEAGRVLADALNDELESKVRDHRPLLPGSAVVTGSGELIHRNGVRHVIHVAAVHGEPGSGFQPIKAVGRCVENALVAAEDLDRGRRILFPLLGTGIGGAPVEPTARTLLSAAANYLSSVARTQITTVLFLAYTDVELWACRRVLDTLDITRIPGGVNDL